MDAEKLLGAVTVVGLGFVGLIAVIIFRRLEANKGARYAKAQGIFGTVFVLSSILFVIMVPVLLDFPNSGGLQAGPVIGPQRPDILGITGLVTAFASCLASITTFIGFIITTVLGIKRERRDSGTAELERKRQEIDLERQKLELEKARGEAKREKEEK